MDVDDRRRFVRLTLPMFHRPAGLLGPRQPARNVGRGGLCVDTDTPLRPGSRLEIELFLPDGDSLSVHVRVAWVRRRPGETEYEAGLEFLELDENRRMKLERCLVEFEAQ